MLLDRRDFLKRSSLLALAPTVPAFLARTARAASPNQDARVHVVIQLDGGNDGLNTVVPFAGGPARKAGTPGAVFAGLESPPVALQGRRAPASSLARLEDFTLTGAADVEKVALAPVGGDDLAAFVRRTTLDAYAAAAQVKE